MKYKIAKRDSLKPNSMKIVNVQENETLLAKTFNDDFFAVSPICTHVGGPLNKGVSHEDRIICP
jgi:nitrite reductase/ring-hydroxylating ferredoxin subunit